MIQACVKFGTVEQRQKLFEQFKGKFSSCVRQIYLSQVTKQLNIPKLEWCFCVQKVFAYKRLKIWCFCMWLSLWPLSVHSWLVSAYKYGKCPLLEGWLYQHEIVFNVKICLKLRKGREIINSVVKIIIAKDYFVLLPCMSLVDRSFSAVDNSLLLVYLIWLIAWLTILLLS